MAWESDALGEVSQASMMLSDAMRIVREAGEAMMDALEEANANGASREDILQAIKSGSSTGDIPSLGNSPEADIRSFLSNMV